MKEDEILQILVDWNFWEKEQDCGIERKSYLDTLSPFINTNQVLAITGPRRSGKSTIMMQLAKRLIEAGVAKENILIVNFEDYRFYEFSIKLLEEIYELYLKRVAKNKKKIIFLDEIHKINGWERFVRTLLDKKEAKIVISGSNSRLISDEYATLLTGRHVKINIFPLGFREFLLFKGIAADSELKLLAKRLEIKKLLDEYLEYGGFAEVVLSEETVRKKILTEYVESIITKDVAERYNVKEKTKLRSLARYYLSNISTKISFNKLGIHLNMPLRTVERFSYYLEEAYLIFFLTRFSFKVREQERAPRKVYAADVGLSNALGFKFSEDAGRIMENVVFLEFMRKNANSANFEIYYWQDYQQKEVDFVVKRGPGIEQLVQVCQNIDEYGVEEREVISLLRASKELKCKNLLVITQSKEGEEVKSWFGIKRKIKFVPLWKWLFGGM